MYKSIYIPKDKERTWRRTQRVANKLKLSPGSLVIMVLEGTIDKLEKVGNHLPDSIKVTMVVPLKRR